MRAKQKPIHAIINTFSNPAYLPIPSNAQIFARQPASRNDFCRKMIKFVYIQKPY